MDKEEYRAFMRKVKRGYLDRAYGLSEHYDRKRRGGLARQKDKARRLKSRHERIKRRFQNEVESCAVCKCLMIPGKVEVFDYVYSTSVETCCEVCHKLRQALCQDEVKEMVHP